MKTSISRLAALLAGTACVLGAGAVAAQSDVEQRAAQPKIYVFGEIDMNRYEIVARPWVDSWRSAFWAPTFPSRDQAVAALQTEAARRGADGLYNVNCLDQRAGKLSTSAEPAFLCYGVAIRVRPGQG
jgi:hypothetical protein